MDNINPNSLLATHPEVAKEWNFEKNKNLTPNDVTKGMRKKVWWKCEKGPDHEWEAMIYSKSSGGSKCPYCNGKKVSITNRLNILCPVVAQEWNYDKNNLGPDEYTCGSNKKVWWKCSKGHEWLSTIANRTNKDTQRGCPYCARKKPSEINRFDIHGSKKVLKEWHPKNEGNPCDYSIGTSKKVWWKCSEGHEWSARISDRTLKGKGCPYCTRQRPSEINRLDLHAPQLIKEWSSKNKADPKEYSVGSDKKVWWTCPKGHEWNAVIHNRVKGVGCPFCAGQKVCENNRLDLHFSHLIKEWCTKNSLCPSDYAYGTCKKVLWTCSKGHEWSARISDRTLKGRGCPYCSGRRPSETNRLDLHGPKDILEEWSSKNDLKMENYSVGSDKKVWWICSKGHEWRARIGNRVRRRSNCPVCEETSGERSIRNWLEKNEIVFESQVQLNPRRQWRYDFYLPDHNIAIEYDGRQHFTLVSLFHKSQSDFEERQKIDLAKTKYCAFHGISLIRINYRYFDEIEDRMEKAINYRKSDKEVLYYFTGIEYDDHEKVFNENLRPL